MQQVDDPPYLTVGTEVSAKYKGAFCEAKVRKVVRNIKCKVAYKLGGLGSGVVSDDQIKGALRVGATVEVKHPERKEYVEATLTKIQDCSQYTVVFDDGDITTLRRSALCLKSGRHFNESETLDQLPLTHPEHFGNPVIGGRRGRRSRHLLPDDSSDEDDEPASNSRSNVSDKEEHIGKVVCVETTDNKKKNPKENWFPGLVVAPTAQDTVRIRVKDEYLVRSFKDGRYYTVPKKEATDFTRECTNKSEAAAVSAALDYMDNDILPPHWDREALFGMSGSCSDSEQELETDSSDDEPTEEKDHFVAQLYKFMDDRGTPLNKVPSIINRDVNLYRLFRAVQKLNGYNRVTSQNQWKQIALRLGFSPATASITNLVKQAYKKFLFSFEEFNRKLGCTMVPHPRTNRSKGRSLVRASSVQSPKTTEKEKPSTSKVVATAEASFGSAPEESGNTSESSTTETKPSQKRKISNVVAGGKVKALVDKFEEKEKDKVKEGSSKREELPVAVKKDKSLKLLSTPKGSDGDKRGRKKRDTDPADSKKDDKDSGKGCSSGASSSSNSVEMKNVGTNESKTGFPNFPIEVGDKLKVFYDEQKVTYEAKVIEIANQEGNPIYLVHYTGWNTRYDEWVRKERIAENLTNNKNKKCKSDKSGSSKNSTTPQGSNNTSLTSLNSSTPSSTTGSSSTANALASTPKLSKRIRGNSKGDITNSNSSTSTTSAPTGSPRSTTPSTSSHRNKSPASAPGGAHRRPITRGGHPAAPSSKRRTSNNTDISSLSIATDDNTSDTDSDEPIKKCPANTNSNSSSSTASSNSSSSSSSSSSSVSSSSTKVSTTAEAGSSSDAAVISDEFSNGASKGRDYDLNQIRSELKGFKELKSPASPASDSTTTATTDVAGAQLQTHECCEDTQQVSPDVANDVDSAMPDVDDDDNDNPSGIIDTNQNTPLKDELEDPIEEEHEKSSESETLSEEDSSQSSNKAFSSSPITAMVDSDTAPETPIPPPTVLTPTPTIVTTSTTASTSPNVSIASLSVKNTKIANNAPPKIVEKIEEKSGEKPNKTSLEEKPSSSSGTGFLNKPPLKTYGTAAAILANAENNAVKFAFSTIIRETEGEKLAPLPDVDSPTTATHVNEIQSTPVISKPSHLLPEDKSPPTVHPVQRNNPSTFAHVVSPGASTITTAGSSSTVPIQAPKNTKLINVQDEIVATVINKSAIAAATTATAVSAAVSSTIPGSGGGISIPTVSLATSGGTSTNTLAALRAEKKLTGDKKVEKVIPISKLGTALIPAEKKLSSSTLTPAQNKLLSKEALSIKSIFESSATRMDEKISDVYEFNDVDYDLDTTSTGTSSRKHVSEVPQAEVVSSLTPALLSDDKKAAKKAMARKTDTLGLAERKLKKISPIKEIDKLKLVRREKERDLEKEKLLLSELEGAAATFSSTMITPEKPSAHFSGFSSIAKSENTFDVLRKSPSFNIVSHRDEKPALLGEEQKPDPTKLAAVIKGIFTPITSPSATETSCGERDKSPSNMEEKVKEEPTLENCKKYFNDMNFEFDAPKVEKPPSIADKVLKALSQQQQQQQQQQQHAHGSAVKSEFPKYIIPTAHHKHHPSLIPIETVVSTAPVASVSLKLEASSFAAVIPTKSIPLHTEPPKIEMPSVILKKEIELIKSIPLASKEPPTFASTSTSSTTTHEILPPTTCTKSQDLTESIKKLETSDLVQAESSRFTHHDEDSTDSNDSEHRLVIEDAEALEPINPSSQQTDFEKLIKIEVDEKPLMTQTEIHSAASAAAVAAVASKEKLVYKTEAEELKEDPIYGLVHGDTKKGKQPSILETIIQSELSTAASRGIGSHGYLKLKDQHDSFAQNELERLRREEQLQQQQQQPAPPPPPSASPIVAIVECSDKKQQQQQQPQQSSSSESLSMLLCEETIPGSPAPVCGVSSSSAQKESTKVYVETGSSFLQPQNIASDLKPVPMDLEPSMDTLTLSGGNPGSSAGQVGKKLTDAIDTPNSSPRDSVSQDENQEPEASPSKKRRQRKTSEEPSNKRRKTTAPSTSCYGSRGSHRMTGNNATDSEDNSDSTAFQRGTSVGAQSSGAGGGSSTASPSVGGRSGRPCQYNFLVNLDPALNSAQRVAILKKKIQELRKTYNAIKAELASIDRRRKKLRRRERENKKQAKLATGGGNC
ncbi:AT-rich interactive domain-containing protein 4B isoform X2 [Toxorhynchites rutilus septentrionalis]|uniref:AT-rich interactive domain-containing protein 4B isoform X2 n=1 Tax=Toxorhynchites rutilus septentrionalis TaxID=329112 RepID=UPI0024794FCC|nr:AT-rich interactive domain-containing protein 4B isoform X2 [Toxorhynchites rutilus septentrionalis]